MIRCRACSGRRALEVRVPQNDRGTTVQDSATISPARRALVDGARTEWIDRLIDPSRNNNLLYFRPLKLATIDLSDSDPASVERLLAEEPVPLELLVSEERLVRAAAQAKEIRKRSIANLEDRGLDTLYATYGMASWPAAGDGRPPEAPVLLLPIEVELRGREGRQVILRRKGDIQVNLVLLHFLGQLGCRITPEALLEAGNTEERFDPGPVLDRLIEMAGGIQGFELTPRLILGNFSFQKMALVKDLRERGEEFAAHDLIAAIAGDVDARQTVTARRGDGSFVVDLEQVPPDEEFVVLDADASQQRAIAATVSGQDGVIDGPPGTGKSQTIANLIASLTARGRRVLFVAEKRAALEVVQRRLDTVDLGHLTLDLHGADLTRARVMAEFAASLRKIREIGPVDARSVHKDFEDRRGRLNHHVRRMTMRRLPAQQNAYEMQVRLLGLADRSQITTRWRGAELDRLTPENAERTRMRLIEAAGFETLFLRTDPSPWTGAQLTDGPTVEDAVQRAERLARVRWPALEAVCEVLAESTGLPAPANFDDATRMKQLLDDVSETLQRYELGIYAVDLDEAVRALGPARAGRWRAARAWCFDSLYRVSGRRTRRCRRQRRVQSATLLIEVEQAADQKHRWRARAGALPRPLPDLKPFQAAYSAVLDDLTVLAGYLGRQDIGSLPCDRLSELLTGLAADDVTPYRLPALCAIERDLNELGAGSLVQELRQHPRDANAWVSAFDFAWLTSCYERARLEDPAFAGFKGQVHDRFVEDFVRLDEERLRLAAFRVSRGHAERVIAVMNANPAQAALVEREAFKKTRHLPLRRLLSEAADVLTALRPCWMASPLAVSQLIPADRRYFDVVIFDEASQVLPEDAVCSILRAGQAVVAGDPRQLPPTPFFAAGDDEDDESDDISAPVGFESVLDLMSACAQPPWTLTWHYRSQDEALIAFSNAFVYDGQLITFPGCGGPPSVRLESVPSLTGRDDRMDSAALEVTRVVELILDHAEHRPGESLGVIALGLSHARRVEAALEAALHERPDLDEFFVVPERPTDRRFFLKNLERVQGDEADAIILTTGVARDRTGRVDLRQFGPLNGVHGVRRLNVAITRARRRMTLVSSISHYDLDPTRAAEGVQLLRRYLEYAASGGARLTNERVTTIEINAFERSVLEALRSKQIEAEPQWGVSGYRIDLAVKHPHRPGRFVMAIECDGASYHSAPTARDRDRLRQQHLEALGWRFHRIWSTDWFLRRDEELSRASEAYTRAVEYADRIDAHHGQSAESSVRSATAASVPAAPATRGRRPDIPARSLRPDHLDLLVRWIQSDGRLRTDEDLTLEAIEELGYERRGKQIEQAIRAAIVRSAIVRSRSPRH
jgi:very-short-patch-repair endonuclease